MEEEDDNLVLGLVMFFLSAVFFCVFCISIFMYILYVYIYMCI